MKYFFLVALAYLPPALGYAAEINAVPDKTKPISFSYISKGNLMIVECKLEGIVPLNMIFDTGAEYSLFFKKPVIDLFKINYGQKVNVVGADRKKILTAYQVHDLNLLLGNYKLNTDFLILKEDYFDIESYVGFRVDGILGANFFKNYLVEVDNRRRIITLHPEDSETVIIPEGFKEIPVVKVKNRLFLPAEITLSNNSAGNVLLLLDSGAATSLLVFIENDTTLIKLTENIVPAKIGLGLGGYLNGYYTQINSLHLGPFELSEMVIQYQEKDSLYLESNFSRKNGLAGNKILDRFNYFMDFKGEKIYLKPNKRFTKEIQYDKSGLTLFASGLYLNKFYIAHVQKNSPAFKAGLQPGDQIISVKGIPGFMLTMDKIYKSFSESEGKRKKLKILRAGKKLKYEIRLASPFFPPDSLKN